MELLEPTICKGCKCELKPGANFCHSCGAKFERINQLQEFPKYIGLKKYRGIAIISVTVTSIIIASIIFKGLRNNSESNRWLELGAGPKVADVPFRLIDHTSRNGNIVKKTHADIASISMAIQSGKAIGAWVYIQASSCFSPRVITGENSHRDFPVLQCIGNHGEQFMISASDSTREKLLGIDREGRLIALKGRAVDMYGVAPVILIRDEESQQ